jgi:hypothetical protein
MSSPVVALQNALAFNLSCSALPMATGATASSQLSESTVFLIDSWVPSGLVLSRSTERALLRRVLSPKKTAGITGGVRFLAKR